MSNEQDFIHQSPGVRKTRIVEAFVLALVTGLMTSGATTYVTVKVLQTQLDYLNGEVKETRAVVERVKSEQDKRTYWIEQLKRQRQ